MATVSTPDKGRIRGNLSTLKKQGHVLPRSRVSSLASRFALHWANTESGSTCGAWADFSPQIALLWLFGVKSGSITLSPISA